MGSLLITFLALLFGCHCFILSIPKKDMKGKQHILGRWQGLTIEKQTNKQQTKQNSYLIGSHKPFSCKVTWDPGDNVSDFQLILHLIIWCFFFLFNCDLNHKIHAVCPTIKGKEGKKKPKINITNFIWICYVSLAILWFWYGVILNTETAFALSISFFNWMFNCFVPFGLARERPTFSIHILYVRMGINKSPTSAHQTCP